MINSRWLLLSVSVIAILVFSTMFASISPTFTPPVKPAEAQAQQLPREQRNWEYVNKDSVASNYNPQTQINKGNVHLLELKWMYPFTDAQRYAANQVGRGLLAGTDAPGVVVDGILYILDNMDNVIALNTETGKVIWINEYKVNTIELTARLPLKKEAWSPHNHAVSYFNGWLVVSSGGCRMRAVDAITGKNAWVLEDLCLNVPGNSFDHPEYKGPGLYSPTIGSHPPTIYEKGSIFVHVIAAGEGVYGGRAFVAGYDITTTPPKQVWRTFLTAPAEGDPDWALRECDKGWFFAETAFKEGKLGIPCSEVRQVCPDCLKNDWGVPKHFGSSITNTWGHMAIDQETGIAYFGTGNATPGSNITLGHPGPLLYSTSIVAVDARTGKMVWWFQVAPRHLTSSDCAWSTMLLTKVRIDGEDRKVVAKGCKTGSALAILDAATGRPLRIIRAPDITASGGPTPVASAKDPRNLADMTRPWCGYEVGVRSGGYCYSSPDRAYYHDNAWDGKTYYFISNGLVSYWYPLTFYGYYQPAARIIVNVPRHPTNHTVYAWDIDANRPKWSYFIGGVAARGSLVVSGGVLYHASVDGRLLGFDADTGKVLLDRPHGITFAKYPILAMDSSGKAKFFMYVGGKTTAPGSHLGYSVVPGALLAYGLPDKLPEPQVITKEVIKEVPGKEVVKEIIKEVPGKETTKTVTVETISPISYAAIGISVVLVVMAGVLFTRRKKA